jgi:hypothetical protein
MSKAQQIPPLAVLTMHDSGASTTESKIDPCEVEHTSLEDAGIGRCEILPKKSLGNRIRRIIWDSLDKSPEERKLITKIDCWVMTYVCIAYFCKYLDQTNVGIIIPLHLILYQHTGLNV